ncbi:Bax inhibitor-1/YccA family protein [Myxococcaceae bacterium GXIMD 01537]
MAWDNPGWQAAPSVNAVLVQESQRAFMSRVYGWMFAGLMLTGVVALFTASNPEWVMTIARWRMGLLLAQLGVVVVLSAAAHRLPGPAAAALFLGYSVLTGLTFSVLFYVYTAGSIGQAFLLTAATYGAMSVYGTVTKKDLSGWGAFLFMGLFGILIAGVINIFVRSDMMGFVTACASVVVFAGLTAYDTQKLRQMHATTGYSSAMSVAISGALTLYLDFINLFLALLRLMGRRR